MGWISEIEICILEGLDDRAGRILRSRPEAYREELRAIAGHAYDDKLNSHSDGFLRFAISRMNVSEYPR